MGTPDFAVASLDLLVKNKFNIVGVVTAPDKPAGRGQQLSQSAVKIYALKHQLNLLQPDNLKADDFIAELAALEADLQLVVAFRMLPEKVWNMPPEGTYNLHASLLPKYRGAAPINWAIINGETESGVTTFKLKHQIDTGNILFNEKVQIKDTDTAGDLHASLMETGAKLLLKTVFAIEAKHSGTGRLKFVTQVDDGAPHAPKIFKETCAINWQMPTSVIYNQIRGLSPYPAAFTQIKNEEGSLKSIKIFYAEMLPSADINSIGAVISDNKTYLDVCCIDGKLRLLDIQLEGKKRMPVVEFLKGYKVGDKMQII